MKDDRRREVILCALQFDETGTRALEAAVRLAIPRENVELHVVHVVGSRTAASLRGEADHFRARLSHAPAELRARIDRACRGTTLNLHAYVREGEPSEEILRTATELRADLIVVGAHRRTGLERIVNGSVAELVLRRAPCPVFVACPLTHERQDRHGEPDAAD